MSRKQSQTDHSKAEPLFCSFCGKAEDDVGALIAGPSAFICENCVEDCNHLMEAEFGASSRLSIEALAKPREIHAYLDNYVVGQAQAKKVLAVAVYNHYKRLAHNRGADALEIAKSNILMIGPSGSGKTMLAETLARYLQVPFAVVDATSLTEAGYVGEDVESVIQKLLQSCDFDPEQAGRGIVYIDEIDKLASRSLNPTHGRDVGGEGVQQGLLKMIEGSVVTVAARGANKRGSQQESVQVDTRNILFICGGAFAGLEKVVARRAAPRGIGFGAPVATDGGIDLRAELETGDLVAFGLIPEFVGRLPIAAVLDGLDEDALVSILTEPRNALVRQYEQLFALDDCELEITADALRATAKEALARGTGARGLRAVLESVLLDAMYTVPARGDVNRVIIDADCLKGSPATYEFARPAARIAQ